MEGTIKVLKDHFGFITCEGEKDDVFFHGSALVDCEFGDLSVGDTLSFEMGEGRNGKTQAVEVSRG